MKSATRVAPCLFVLLFVTVMFSQSATAQTKPGNTAGTLLPGASFPVGSATLTKQVDCPKSALAGNCYMLTISCPGIADQTEEVKISNPTGFDAIGFFSGGDGSGMYEQFTNAISGMQQLITMKNAILVQIRYRGTNGWLLGPGGARALACRTATFEYWVATAIAPPGAYVGFTGNSGGGSAALYPLAYYGLDSLPNLALVITSSGPSIGDLYVGCSIPATTPPTGVIQAPAWACSKKLSPAYHVTDRTTFIDVQYGYPICSQYQSSYDDTLKADSLFSATAQTYFKTLVSAKFAGKDAGGIALGWQAINQIQSQVQAECIPDAIHELPNSLSGMSSIVSDFMNLMP